MNRQSSSSMPHIRWFLSKSDVSKRLAEVRQQQQERQQERQQEQLLKASPSTREPLGTLHANVAAPALELNVQPAANSSAQVTMVGSVVKSPVSHIGKRPRRHQPEKSVLSTGKKPRGRPPKRPRLDPSIDTQASPPLPRLQSQQPMAYKLDVLKDAVFLGQRELDILSNPVGWINDTIINFALAYYHDSEPDTTNRRLFHVVNSFWVPAMLEKLRKPTSILASQKLPYSAPPEAEYIVAPYYSLKNRHWVLAVFCVDPGRTSLVVLDSLRRPISSPEFVPRPLRKIAKALGIPESECSTIRPCLQKDKHSCGLAVIAGLIKVFKYHDTYSWNHLTCYFDPVAIRNSIRALVSRELDTRGDGVLAPAVKTLPNRSSKDQKISTARGHIVAVLDTDSTPSTPSTSAESDPFVPELHSSPSGEYVRPSNGSWIEPDPMRDEDNASNASYWEPSVELEPSASSDDESVASRCTSSHSSSIHPSYVATEQKILNLRPRTPGLQSDSLQAHNPPILPPTERSVKSAFGQPLPPYPRWSPKPYCNHHAPSPKRQATSGDTELPLNPPLLHHHHFFPSTSVNLEHPAVDQTPVCSQDSAAGRLTPPVSPQHASRGEEEADPATSPAQALLPPQAKDAQEDALSSQDAASVSEMTVVTDPSGELEATGDDGHRDRIAVMEALAACDNHSYTINAVCRRRVIEAQEKCAELEGKIGPLEAEFDPKNDAELKQLRAEHDVTVKQRMDVVDLYYGTLQEELGEAELLQRRGIDLIFEAARWKKEIVSRETLGLGERGS